MSSRGVCMFTVWGMQANQTRGIPAWSRTHSNTLFLRLEKCHPFIGNVIPSFAARMCFMNKADRGDEKIRSAESFRLSRGAQNHLLSGQMRLSSLRCYQNWCWCFTNEVSQCLHGCSGSGSEETKWVAISQPSLWASDKRGGLWRPARSDGRFHL